MSVVRRLVLVTAASAAVILTTATPAWAGLNVGHASAGDSSNPASGFAGASFSVSAPAASGGGVPTSGGGVHYSASPGHGGGGGGPTGPPAYVVISPYLVSSGPNGQSGQYVVDNPALPGGSPSACGAIPICFIPTGPAPVGAKGPAAPPPPPSPAQLALMAASRMVLPPPTIQTWPPAGKGLVNLGTWVHVTNWAPSSTSASAGPVTSTVTATPTSVVVSAPDSTDAGADYQTISVTCSGPGPIYNESIPDNAQSSPCKLKWAWPSANYDNSGDYPLTVAVHYQVAWSASGAPGGGTLPSITSTTTIPTFVGEIQAIGVP